MSTGGYAPRFHYLQRSRAHPFIFPAMGSHDGATSEGQRKVLEDYGVTPDFVAATVRPSMETVLLGERRRLSG